MAAAEKRASVPSWLAITLSLLAGAAMPLQSKVNGAAASSAHDSSLAALFSFGGGFVILALIAVLTPWGRKAIISLGTAAKNKEFPWWYLGAGLLGAWLVLTQSISVAVIGVAIFTVSVIAGQAVAGLVVDRLGFGTGIRRELTALRVIGAVLTVLAVAWSVSGQLAHADDAWANLGMALLPFSAGLLSGFQQAMNGAITMKVHNPFSATLANFTAGTTALFIAWLVNRATSHTPFTLPAEWWMYLGGPLGIFFIFTGAMVVPRIGVLIFSLCTVCGQLVSSFFLDVFFPTATTDISISMVGGIVLTLVSVLITSLPQLMRKKPA